MPITSTTNATNPIRNDRQAYGVYDLKNPTEVAVDNASLITTDTLASNPKEPRLPTTALDTTGTGLGSYIETKAISDQTEVDKKRQEALDTKKTDITSKFNELLGVNTELGGVAADRTRQDSARKTSDRLNAQIMADAKATRDRIESLKHNFGGTTAGLANEIGRIQNESSNHQADLAILKYVADNDYQGAKEIADRQVELKTSELKTKADNLKAYIEFNKADFDKEELRVYNEAQKKADREYDAQVKTEEAISEIKLNAAQNEVPASMLQKLSQAKTLDEALAISGKYGTDYLTNQVKKANLEKTYKEIDKLNKEIGNLTNPLDTSNLPNTTAGFVTKLMASSKNEKDLDASERQSLSKARTVIGQLDSLQTNIAGQNKTGFLKGKVNNLLESVGLNADVGVINAQLQAVVPNLARGTYGEVGVLTDNDIANYRKTLPRLDRPKDQNDAVLAMTLKTVLNSIENTLSTATNSNINVSGWAQDYLKIKNQITDIEDRIGISKEAINNLILSDKTLSEPIKEMYQQGLTDGEILEALNAR